MSRGRRGRGSLAARMRHLRADAAALLPAVLALVSGCAMQAPAGPGSAPVPAVQSPQAPTGAAAAVDRAPARLAAASPGQAGASAACLGQVESFAELHSGNRVMLGPAAFANGDQLVLTRVPHRGPDGRPLDGRAAPPQPLVLHLVAGPRGCVVEVAAGSVAPRDGGAPPPSADLPACTCVSLG